jgi:hypothetical protein
LTDWCLAVFQLYRGITVGNKYIALIYD